MYDLVIDLWGVSLWIQDLPCRCHISFHIKEVKVGKKKKRLKTNLCYKKTREKSGLMFCVWYAQRHLSLIYRALETERETEREMEREVLQQSATLPPPDMMAVDFDRWHLLFPAFQERKKRKKKHKAFLPLRNYSNDLQWCMFPFFFPCIFLCCCGNMRTHTDISITYAQAQSGPNGCNHALCYPQSLRIRGGSRTDTHNSDKSGRICIQRQQKERQE